MKYRLLLVFALALVASLSIGGAVAAADAPPPSMQEQSATSVDFIFGHAWGQVTVSGLPGSSYAVRAPMPDGTLGTLAIGFVDQSGSGRSLFPVGPMLEVHSITVAVSSPGLPPMIFAYDSDLDRWILD